MRSGVYGWYYWITGPAPIVQFVCRICRLMYAQLD